MKATLFLLVISAILISCDSKSQNHPINSEVRQPNDELKGYVNEFFSKYKNESSGKAIDYIFKNNSSTAGIDNLKSKLDSTRAVIGNFTGFEQITKKDAGNGLILLSYLVKHEKQPIRFTFIFYKPKTNWIIYKFNFDTDVVEELEYSGKIYFIK